MIGKSCKRKDSSFRLLVSVAVSLALREANGTSGMALWVVLCKEGRAELPSCRLQLHVKILLDGAKPTLLCF